MTKSSQTAWLIYDGECPFCSAYVRLVRLRDTIGELHLVNARDGGPLVDEIISADLDLDEGMVLKWNDRLYHGADCIRMVAMMSTPSTAFNRLNMMVFRSPALSCILYPILRTGRNGALWLLGRRKLDLRKPTSSSP